MPRSATIARIVLLLVVGGALAVRWMHLDAQSLWYDEGYTAWITGLSPGRIVRVLASDPMPPLHYVLLHWWRGMFGDGDAALRSFSAACSTAALGVFWVLARRILTNPWAVTWAMALMGFSAIQVQFAREARYPALLSLLAVLMLEGMDRLGRSRSRWAMAQFIIASAAALYTHAIAAFYLLAIQIAWLIWPRHKDEGGRMQDEPEPASQLSSRILHPYLSLLLADALILLIYAPWLPVLKRQLQWMSHTGFWDTVPDFSRLLWTVAVLAGVKSWYPGRAVTFLRGGGWEYSTQIASAVIVLILLAGLALILWRGTRTARRLAAALAAFALLPVLILFIQSLIRQPAFVERTLIMSSPALCLLLAIPFGRMGVAASAAHLRRPWRLAYGLLLGFLLGAAVWSVGGVLGEERTEDWRGVAHAIASLPDERRLLVFLGNEGQLPFDHYASRASRHPYAMTGAPRGFFDLDPPQTMQRIRTDADLAPFEARLEGGNAAQIVLILRNEPYYDPGGRVRRLLDETYLFSGERQFNKILVRFYTPRPGGRVSLDDGLTATH